MRRFYFPEGLVDLNSTTRPWVLCRIISVYSAEIGYYEFCSTCNVNFWCYWHIICYSYAYVDYSNYSIALAYHSQLIWFTRSTNHAKFIKETLPHCYHIYMTADVPSKYIPHAKPNACNRYERGFRYIFYFLEVSVNMAHIKIQLFRRKSLTFIA